MTIHQVGYLPYFFTPACQFVHHGEGRGGELSYNALSHYMNAILFILGAW